LDRIKLYEIVAVAALAATAAGVPVPFFEGCEPLRLMSIVVVLAVRAAGSAQ
jgi:hypothetical protein